MGKLRFEKIDLIDLNEYYINRQMSIFQISEMLNCAVSCVFNSLKRQGIKTRTLSQTKKGNLNPQWKGNKVKYHAIHSYVKRYKPKPKLCEYCGLKPPYDLANINGKYKRDLKDWEWLCRKCHMEKDGRIEKLIERNKNVCSKTLLQ